MRVIVILVLSALVLAACGEGGEPEAAQGDGIAVELALGGLDGPQDATPSVDGSTIFYVTDGDSGSGLFKIEGTDGELLASFERASSLVLSAEGATIFVGDREGGIFAVPAAGGAPAVLAGTEGFKISHLDRDGAQIVFVGTDAEGVAGIWSAPIGGGEVAEIEVGLEAAPTGILALGGGELIVAHASGLVERIGGAADGALLEGKRLGTPTGMALSGEGATLMVSSLSAAGTAQVVLVPLDGGEPLVFDDTIRENRGAGGLRCTANASVCAWNGVAAGTGGKVYRIQF